MASPTVLVALMGAIVTVAVQLTKLQLGQDSMRKELKDELKLGLADIADAVAGVRRHGRSLAQGLRDAAPGTTAVACASPEEVEAWAVRIGYGHVAHKLRPLRGSGVMLQTEGSLAALGIEEADCKLLMEHICALQ